MFSTTAPSGDCSYPKPASTHARPAPVSSTPTVAADQAHALRTQGAPVYRSLSGTCRASAGWLLESCGYQPGAQVTRGVRCSTRRTLTLTAQAEATARTFRAALEAMAMSVHTATGITLHPEPVAV
ncbi:hypothetical protein [Streptomyces sp. NPDC091027]|uniref:hypothetical protein n=1 Tax=Streptomyces sp. NPDC091027 TaxID=3365971 RepID=UPI0037FA036F